MMEFTNKMQITVIIVVLILQSHMLLFSYSKSIVKNLPDFSGDLPFTLETGYVGVGEGEKVQLFYYFVESDRNPQKDPLVLYLTGGPGSSAVLPLLYQLGPLHFQYANARRTKVKLELNPYSWTKTANIIFIDLPVGTGFSYAKTWELSRSSDSLVVTHAHDFIRKWLIDHPQFLSNPLYISGISYMGLIIPNVVSNIYDDNEQGIQPILNVKGYLIASPFTDKFIDYNSRVEYAYRAALIDDEIYESVKENCQGKYVYVDPNNTLCLNSLQLVNECINKVSVFNIQDPVCDPQTFCRESIYAYSNIWANKKATQKALHVREGTVENWRYSNSSLSGAFGKNETIYFSYNVFSSLPYHKKLTSKNCQALIINGDLDMIFPYVGTRQWINTLILRITSPWKPWFVGSQVAGYQMTYSYNKYSLKYATIKGAGHSVALYKPEESMVLVATWLASHTNP